MHVNYEHLNDYTLYLPILLRNPLLEVFDKDFLIKLLEEGKFCCFKNFKSGENILTQDTVGTNIEVLASGKAEILQDGIKTGVKCQSGDTIGEIGAITNNPRMSTVQAISDVITFSINIDGIKGQNFDKWWKALSLSLIEKLEDQNKPDAIEAWKHFSCYLANKLKKRNKNLIA